MGCQAIIAGLGIREWQCSVCETVHDLDINAARNILALGRERLAGVTTDCCGPGILALPAIIAAANG